MSGFVGDLSQKQEAALKQMKENLKDSMKPRWDDHYLLRWLRARNFDVKKAEKLLRENVVWRKRIDADNMLDYFPGGYCGEDKQGHPIWIDTMGCMDLKGMMYSATKKDILKYKAVSLELFYQKKVEEVSKKYGRHIDQTTLIFDMDHFGLKFLWKPVVDLVTEILAIFEANYPEILKTAYIINAPSMFPVMWNIAKPFLEAATRKKIKFLGKNWKSRLLEDIDADQLPVHWGGTMRGPDGNECGTVCMGGKIPEKYRLKNIRENMDFSNFENCTVQRGSSVQLDYDVTEPGSTLRWQILSEGNDIGFGIYKRTSDVRQKKGEMEEVLKNERINSHMVPEEGSIVLNNTGTYVVRFDNTYSWVNAKKIDYQIDVLAPDQENELQITSL